jgi:hypothetical protein
MSTGNSYFLNQNLEVGVGHFDSLGVFEKGY